MDTGVTDPDVLGSDVTDSGVSDSDVVDTDLMDLDVVRTEEELRAIMGAAPRGVIDKVVTRIDEQSRLFIEKSPFFLLATGDGAGGIDVSPRGDPPGSVLVLDDRTLAIADRKGNRRLDSMRNILRNPAVGTLFVVPGICDTLRVNGRATIVRRAPFFERMTVDGKTPRLAILIEVEELYLHCAKAFLRSSLWRPDTWPDRDSVPSAGRLYRSQTGSRIPESVINAALRRDARKNRY